MKKLLLLACLSPLMLGQQCPSPSDSTGQDSTPPPAAVENPQVRIDTPHGPITLELFAVQAPKTTQAFLQYVNEQFFDNTVIHSADPTEGIRGGRFTDDLSAKATREPIPNESSNGLSNNRRYIAMVESADTGSTTAEFVIYTTDSKQQDYVPGTDGKTGRTVFGRVINGMGVVDAIAAVSTGSYNAQDNTPLTHLPAERVLLTFLQTAGEKPPVYQEPAIVCPPAVETESTGTLTPVSLGTATATDASGQTLTVTNDAPSDGFPIGVTPVTWTATDAEGRVVQCTQNVTVMAPVVTTASGLKFQDIVVGTGPQPPNLDATVVVNYVGTLEDGTQFDKGEVVDFVLSGVIPGFSEGILSMHVGGKRKLIIPPDLGYGASGSPPKIPGNATLIFVVDLLELQ